MNPLKWSAWIRIAAVASVPWIGWVFADSYRCGSDRTGRNYCGFSFPDLFWGLLPIFLFWGVVWIAHGIRLRHMRRKVTMGDKGGLEILRGVREMRTWLKYLIIGWSIVSVGIVIVSFQLMKSNFIEEDYTIMTVYKVPEKVAGTNPSYDLEMIGETLFTKSAYDPLSILDQSITKKEFVDKMKKAKGVTIESNIKVKDNSIYLLLPLYAFTIWTIPILVFSLIGIIFGRMKCLQMKDELGK